MNASNEVVSEKLLAVASTKEGETLTFPLQTGDGVVMNDVSGAVMNGEVVLHGHDAFHPDVLIRTTRKEIEDVMEAMADEGYAKWCFRQSWDRIKKVNTDDLYKEGGAKWKDFLDDIVVYYCARYKVFGKPMPAVMDPQIGEMCEKIGKGDALADLSNKTIVEKK